MILKILKTKVNKIKKTIKRDDSCINGEKEKTDTCCGSFYINSNKKLSTYKHMFQARLLHCYYRIKSFENIAAFY